MTCCCACHVVACSCVQLPAPLPVPYPPPRTQPAPPHTAQHVADNPEEQSEVEWRAVADCSCTHGLPCPGTRAGGGGGGCPQGAGAAHCVFRPPEPLPNTTQRLTRPGTWQGRRRMLPLQALQDRESFWQNCLDHPSLRWPPHAGGGAEARAELCRRRGAGCHRRNLPLARPGGRLSGKGTRCRGGLRQATYWSKKDRRVGARSAAPTSMQLCGSVLFILF